MAKVLALAAAEDDQSLPQPVCCGAVRRSRAGRLKIFLGAAPGVGTTCEMLRAGIEKRRQKVDVAVAIAETYGRKEAQALLRELELVPGRRMSPGCGGERSERGAGEMDLDAVLKRHPALALVDEFAHINAPGSLHPRRFMEVCELLQAGIDVYTTLHMHQVESLNALVAKITRVQRGEIVPDSLVNRADEIEVIDAAPWDIAERLRRGKRSLWFAVF